MKIKKAHGEFIDSQGRGLDRPKIQVQASAPNESLHLTVSEDRHVTLRRFVKDADLAARLGNEGSEVLMDEVQMVDTTVTVYGDVMRIVGSVEGGAPTFVDGKCFDDQNRQRYDPFVHMGKPLHRMQWTLT